MSFEGWEHWTVMKNLLKDYKALVQRVCFNPQDKSNSVGFENITELRFVYKDDIKFARAGLEPMGVMKNLKRLEITYYNICSKPTFQPWFKGFRFSSDLKEVQLILNTNVFNSAIFAWGDLISQYLPQITKLEVGKQLRRYEKMDTDTDFSWISKLKNLKTLDLLNLNLEPIYKTPMTNVKRLELRGVYGGFFKNSTSLVNLSEIFPALDTLIIENCDWEISALEDGLKSLGNFENLRAFRIRCALQISNDFDKQMVKSTMEQALEIIEKKFPVDPTEIVINAFLVDCRLTIIKVKGKKEPSLKITSVEDDITSDSEDSEDEN